MVPFFMLARIVDILFVLFILLVFSQNWNKSVETNSFEAHCIGKTNQSHVYSQ